MDGFAKQITIQTRGTNCVSIRLSPSSYSYNLKCKYKHEVFIGFYT
jgi:hypothetical protein